MTSATCSRISPDLPLQTAPTLRRLGDARREKCDAQPTLGIIRKLSLALAVNSDWLLFDADERGPDDSLKHQFEALRQFDDDERHVAEVLFESLILQHQAKRAVMRMQPVRKTEKKHVGGRR